jgi:hypothetical protein
MFKDRRASYGFGYWCNIAAYIHFMDECKRLLGIGFDYILCVLCTDVYRCVVTDKGRTEKETWMVGFPLIMGILIEWYKDRDRAKYYKKMFEEE